MTTQAHMTGAFSPERNGHADTASDIDNGTGPGLGGDPGAR